MSARLFWTIGSLIALAVAAQPAAATELEVHLREQHFEPKIVSAMPGDTIVFYNDDNELHSVFLPDNQSLLAERFIQPRASYEVIIPATADPAIYNLVCTIHMNMQGTLQIMAR
jgi:plastocyanin